MAGEAERTTKKNRRQKGRVYSRGARIFKISEGRAARFLPFSRIHPFLLFLFFLSVPLSGLSATLGYFRIYRSAAGSPVRMDVKIESNRRLFPANIRDLS